MGADLWVGMACGAVATALAALALGTVEGIPSAAPVASGGTPGATGAAPAADRSGCTEVRDQLDALRREVGEARRHAETMEAAAAWARGQMAAVAGEPRPWPVDVPEPFRPERFEQELAARLAEHPGVGLEAVDCAEHPCVALIRVEGYGGAPDGAVGEAAPAGVAAVRFRQVPFSAFGAFAREAYGTGFALGNHSMWNGETGLGHLAVAAYPTGDGELEKRVEHRLDLLLAPALAGSDGPGGGR